MSIKPPAPAPALTPRQAEIIRIARQRNRVVVDELATRFDVSPQTIRKDLNDLCDADVMQRVHGGAILTSGVTNVAYEARRALADVEKQRIGILTAKIIPDGSSLFINIGTTTEQVAIALHGKRDLMVVTNNLNVAHSLVGNDEIELLVAGGTVRHTDGGVVGDSAVRFVEQFRLDMAVIGTSAIDVDGALLDYDSREIDVTRAMLASARRSILVADAMKFERTAPVFAGSLMEMDTFVTDTVPPTKIASLCEAKDTTVVTTADYESS